MTKQQFDTASINAALHRFLIEPLTDEQSSALNIAGHFAAAATDATVIEARTIYKRNLELPYNFTESLDTCRLVENRLDKSLHLRYAARVMEHSGHGWQGLAFATPLQRATALVEILGFEVCE